MNHFPPPPTLCQRKEFLTAGADLFHRATPPSRPPASGAGDRGDPRIAFTPRPRTRPQAAAHGTMRRCAPTSLVGVHRVLFLATLALLLAQTLASSSSSAAVSGDPCAVSMSDGGDDAPSCPVRCFRPDPVCGADGVTYWCGCPEAACAGARVAKRGFCEVGAGSAPVSGQALLLVHIVWLFVLGAAVLLGFL